MNSKPSIQLSPSQRQLLATSGIPLWQKRTDSASKEQNLKYYRIGQWLFVAPELPIPSPAWFVDLCHSLVQLQSGDVSAVPVEVSASIASTWRGDFILQVNQSLSGVPTHETKRVWWKHLCQSQSLNA